MANTWVIVADSSRARIFERRGRSKKLAELLDLAHPEGRAKGRDLLTDAPGRAFDSGGQGRHAMGQEVDVRRHENEVFAGEIAQRLETGRTRNKFGQLILVAPPQFLGLLRGSLSPPTQALVQTTINKNIVQLKPEEISNHLEV